MFSFFSKLILAFMVLNLISLPLRAGSVPKTGYVVFKKTTSNIHAYVPETYDPKKSYPLLIGLHYAGGNGQEFLPALQLEAQKRGWITACPDSENHSEWLTIQEEYRKNLFILRKTLSTIRSRYNVDPSRCFLLGAGSGGKFLLFLLLKEPIFLKSISGVVVLNAEIQNDFDNNFWKGLGARTNWVKKPILQLQCRDDAYVPYPRARWTRDALRKAGYVLHYVEEDSFGNSYPSHLNPKLFEWALGDKASVDEIQEKSESIPIPVSEEFEILSFEKGTSEAFSGESQFDKGGGLQVLTSDSSGPGGSQLQYGSSTRERKYTYRVTFRPKKDFNQKDQNVDLKTEYRNVRVDIKTFDAAKALTYTNRIAFYGREGIGSDREEYARKQYGNLAEKTDRQADYAGTLQGGQMATLVFDAPRDRDQTFACVVIYKNTRPVAFAMLPKTANPAEFPDLSTIAAPREAAKRDSMK